MFSGCSVILKERKNNRITKRVYMGKSAGSRLVSGSQKSWIDSGNECLKKRGMDVGQARGMVHYRSERRRFGRENAWVTHSPGNEPLTLKTCHVFACDSHTVALGEGFSMTKATRKGNKGEFFIFITHS